MKKRGWQVPALVVSALVLAVCIFFMWGFASNWGGVEIERNTGLYLNGERYAYVSYVQKDATSENPMPAVVILHGNNDNAQGFSGWAIELARRGYNVFVPDQDGVGLSDWGWEDNTAFSLYFTQMVMDLPFVSEVVVSGHSLGGNYSTVITQELDVAGCVSVSAIIPPTEEAEAIGNMAFIIGKGDEKNQFDPPSRFVEQSFATFAKQMFGTEWLPELDTAYGSVEDNDYRMFSIYDGFLSNHSAARYSSDVIEYLCHHAELFAPTDTDLTESSLVYQWYSFFSFIGMIAFAAVSACLFIFLMGHPFFNTIKRDLPANIANKGKKWVISAAIGMLAIVPLFLAGCWFVIKCTSLKDGNPLLPVGNMNRYIVFLLFLGIFEIAVFYFFFFRPRKLKYADCGLAWNRGNVENILKTMLLSAIVSCVMLTLLYILDIIGGLAFTCGWMVLRVPSFAREMRSVAYIPLFLILFIGVNLGGNITRRLDPIRGRASLTMLRDVVVNSIVSAFVITLMFFFNMWCNSQQIFIPLFEGINTYYLYNFMMIAVLAQIINTVLYRKSGTIWPGVFLCTILFGVMLPAGFPISYY